MDGKKGIWRLGGTKKDIRMLGPPGTGKGEVKR